MQAYVQCCGICATFYKLLFYIADTAHTLLQFPQIAGFKKLPNYVTGHTFALRGDNHPVVILTVAMCWINLQFASFLSHFVNARDRVRGYNSLQMLP